MNPWLFTAQLGLPIALLCWLRLCPSKGTLSYSLQVLAVLCVLSGVTLAGLWMMPPFWVPYIYLFLLLIIVGVQWFGGKAGGQGIWSSGVLQSTAIFLSVLAGSAGASLSVIAVLARKPSNTEIINLSSPFPEGTYLVVNGGSNVIMNAHMGILDPGIERFREWRGQSRALDLIKINAAGFRVDGVLPADPERYITFGEPVLAPCAGRIALAVDGVPDNTVPVMNREAMAGNYVAIECAPNRFVILAHFRNNSLEVKQGQQVEVGDYLGEMGNSGNSSEPHLHIHAQLGLPKNTPLGGEPLEMTIEGRYLVRNERFRNGSAKL